MTKKVGILFLLALTILILSYTARSCKGPFLFRENNALTDTGDVPVEERIPPVKYSTMRLEVKGLKQAVNILEVNPADKRVLIKPVLSHDRIFGFEKLAAMVEKTKAYAAVNGGFFYEYGQPGGMVMIDGRIITGSAGRFPVFIFNHEKAELREVTSKLWLSYEGKRLEVSAVNTEEKPGAAIIYTNDYGTDNRAKSRNISVVIENNVVRSVGYYEGAVKIPGRGMVLTFYGAQEGELEKTPLTPGTKVEFKYEPELGEYAQAYECGSWIVKNGEIVIGQRDPWIGVTTNRDPRTAVGIKDNNHVVLVTVDGRQPGYSAGLTGRELGELLLQMGIRDAAMLDGGASTEMMVQGKTVNRPSHKGEGRMLAGALVVQLLD